MTYLSLYPLAAALSVLVLLAAWFSASEAGATALSRARLEQLVSDGRRGAGRLRRLLRHSERFVTFTILGNRCAVVLLAQTATLAALQIYGERSLPVVTLAVTLVVVVCAELLPRAAAVAGPERAALWTALPLAPLLLLARPLILALDGVTRLLLRALGIAPRRPPAPNDRDELRAALREAGALMPQKHREMFFGLLDLEDVTVEDIMVPRAEVVAIDLEKPWIEIAERLQSCPHSRVPCYRGTLDRMLGILHMRSLGRLFRTLSELDVPQIEALLVPAYFAPVKANLYAQLINFQVDKQSMALAVDEYGDIEGLVTLDDLLEQVVGRFKTVPQFGVRAVYRQADGSFVVDGSANIRELNRTFHWALPEHGPKTLNGLILEALEDIPDPGTSLRIGEYTIEVVHSSDQAVRSARIVPPASTSPPAEQSAPSDGERRDA